MPPPPPAVTEELVEEILLRLPPHEPARLVRAALVCKTWSRLISSPSFRRRFSAFHRAPPMLGYLCNTLPAGYGGDSSVIASFGPASSSRVLLPDRRPRCCRVLDARHGRVLLLLEGPGDPMFSDLAVWDPVTEELSEFPFAPLWCLNWTAAVLCAGAAAGDCDHLDCHGGPFLVVLVGSQCLATQTFTCTYSSDAAAWSGPVSTNHPSRCCVDALMPSVLLGNALYFSGRMTNTGFKYDLQFSQMSMIQLPALDSGWPPYVFTTTECGGLGVAAIHGSKLYMCSRNAALEGDSGWTQSRAVALDTLLHVPAECVLASPKVVGFADGFGTIFCRVNDVLYTIDIKTYKVKKVYEGRTIGAVVPYISFYTPGK